MKHYEDANRPRAELPLVEWACQTCLFRIQTALDGVLRNYPIRALGIVLRGLIFPLGRRHREPADALGHRVAKILLTPSDARDRLTQGIYLEDDPSDILGCLEDTLRKTLVAEPIRRQLRKGGYSPSIGVEYEVWLNELVAEGTITEVEKDSLIRAHSAVLRVISVDDFPPDSTLSGENAGRAA